MLDTERSILIVDDEDDGLHVLWSVLRAAGFPVLVARNGAEALDALEKHRVALVVSDLVMAGMDGIDLLREIRRRSIGTKFIIVTGHGDVTTYLEAMNLGALEYLNKPVDPSHLMRLVTNDDERCRSEIPAEAGLH